MTKVLKAGNDGENQQPKKKVVVYYKNKGRKHLICSLFLFVCNEKVLKVCLNIDSDLPLSSASSVICCCGQFSWQSEIINPTTKPGVETVTLRSRCQLKMLCKSIVGFTLAQIKFKMLMLALEFH